MQRLRVPKFSDRKVNFKIAFSLNHSSCFAISKAVTMLFYKTPFSCLGYSQLLIFVVVLEAIIQFVDCPDPVFLLPFLPIMCFENKEEKRKDLILTVCPLDGYSDGRFGKRCWNHWFKWICKSFILSILCPPATALNSWMFCVAQWLTALTFPLLFIYLFIFGTSPRLPAQT